MFLPRIRSRTILCAGLVLVCCLFSGCGEQPAAPLQAATVTRSTPAPPPLLARPVEDVEEEPAPAVAEPNANSKLPAYEIRMNARHLAAMDQNPYGEELYPATFTAEGVTYENVKIRYRGAWGRTWPKKPMKIFFNDDKPFKGQRRLNLNSSFRDPSFIRETLAYHVYNISGSPAPLSQVVRVHLNGKFRGLYVQVEQPDKAFMKRVEIKGATMVKASSRMKVSDERPFRSLDEYRMHYEQENRKEEDIFPELDKFCRELAQNGDALAFFEKHVDLEKYINYLAATTLCQNWDGYNKNHFLVHDTKGSKKWFVIPWDLDRAIGDHWDWSFGRADLPIELGTQSSPAITGWNRMMDRFFSHPELRRRLADRLQQLIEKEYTIEKLGPIIDQWSATISSDAALDHKRWPNVQGMGWYRNDEESLEESMKVVKRFIEDRRKFVASQLPKLRS